MTFTQSPAIPPVPTKAAGISVAALVLGIAAFVCGIVPFLGILVAIAGIVIGVLALKKPGPTTLPTVGLVLSAIAAITNIIAIVVVFTVVPAAWERANHNQRGHSDGGSSQGQTEGNADGGAGSSKLRLTTSTTPCFSFDAPREFISNQSKDSTGLCVATRQGWGERSADGVIKYTGVGDIWDQVLVEPIRVSTTDTMAPDGELDTMVDYLSANYFPQLGTVISLREPITLDGQEANLTRLESTAESTVTKATVVVKAPKPYDTANGPVQFFLITFVIDDDRGDTIIDAAAKSWSWK